MRWTMLLPLLLTSFAFGEADDLRYKDKVYMVKGEPKVVEIVDETFDKVKIKLGQSAVSEISRDEIVRIDYDANSGGVELKNLERAVNGPADEARKLARELINRAQSGRKLFEQFGLYRLGQIEQNAGNWKDASAAFADLIAKYPNPKYLYEAMEGAIYCFISDGKPADGKAVLAKFTVVPEDGGKFQATKTFLSAWIAEEMHDNKAALDQYSAAAGAAARFPDLCNKAKAGKGRCLVLNGDFAAAEATFRQVIDGGGKGMQLGAAWNGLGDISYMKAEGEKNPANKTPLYHEALMRYLRAAILYEPQEGESPEEKAKGLARGAYCFAQLAESQTEATMKADYRGRAVGLKGEAVQIGGRWGKWAEQHVK